MLVPVRGGTAALQRRQRQIHQHNAVLANIKIPKVYIFNVGREEWRNRVGAGKSYVIPGCPRGRKHSEALEISALVPSEIDLADGGGNMGVIDNPGLTSVLDGQTVVGVANDIIGTNSTTPGLDPHTTNLEWFGVFATENFKPTAEELEVAREKRHQLLTLLYEEGSEKVRQNEKVILLDRKPYNSAADELGYKPLWGSNEHALDRCVYCREPIQSGAVKCKHCNSMLNTLEAKKLAKQMESGQESEPVSAE